MSVKLVIEFPTEEHLDSFHGWLCDGGGECGFFDADEIHNEDNPIVSFQYHAENKKYKQNDSRRYSAFPEGNKLIIAHAKDEEDT